MRTSGSKKFAWTVLFLATMLSGTALYLKQEGAAMAFWSTGVPSAVALYANKQHQDRKKLEIEKSNRNGNTN